MFDGQSTLFDFLLATPLTEAELAGALATLDPARGSLKIEMALSGKRRGQGYGQEARPGGEPDAQGAARAAAGQDLIPRGILEPLEAFAETTARQHGRQIDLQISGGDLVLDLDMLDELKPHLRSLIEFCVTESIEPPGERTAAGKGTCGKLRLALSRNEECVVATLSDDGLGLKACPDGEAGALFARTRAAIHSRGGELRIESPAGGGVRFQVTLPLAMAVLDGMVVRVGEYRYVVPLGAIQRIVHSGQEDMMRLPAGESHMLKLGHEDLLPVHSLKAAATEDSIGERDAPGGQRYLFVVVGKQSQRIALLVDELMGQQLVLIRPLRGYLAGIHGVTGCALLGGGDVGMVLDIGRLLNPET